MPVRVGGGQLVIFVQVKSGYKLIFFDHALSRSVNEVRRFPYRQNRYALLEMEG